MKFTRMDVTINGLTLYGACTFTLPGYTFVEPITGFTFEVFNTIKRPDRARRIALYPDDYIVRKDLWSVATGGFTLKHITGTSRAMVVASIIRNIATSSNPIHTINNELMKSYNLLSKTKASPHVYRYDKRLQQLIRVKR